jgi:arylsulfatase A-like enzyme
MNKITTLTFAALLLVPSAVLYAGNAAKPARPNILFLFSDDQRFDTIRALGNDHIRTPHLDRLVLSGTVFSRAYIMGGNNGAVCMPSRAMLMSGRTLFRIDNQLKGQTTWPEQFAKAGYSTFITGKWHNGSESVLRSFQQGQAVFLGGMGNPYKLPLQDIGPDHQWTNKRVSGEHSVKLFADAAIQFIRQDKGGRPFLCYFAPNCPHDPRMAPQSYHDYYNAHQPLLPANFLPQHPFDNGELVIRDELLAPWPRTPEVVRQHLADYYAYINYLDDQIGRILDALKASGQFDNTIIVFSSDNGLAIGSHGLFGKQNVYDHATHEPLIFAGPGIPAGQRRDAFCYLFDIFPTLGALAGVAAPDGNEGQSVVPVITGQASQMRDSIFTAYRHLHRAVRDDRWKLIVYTQINKTQLFDLGADPAETKDLAAERTHAAEIDRLTALLKDWQQKLGDTQPLTTDQPRPVTFDFTKVKVGKRPKSGLE